VKLIDYRKRELGVQVKKVAKTHESYFLNGFLHSYIDLAYLEKLTVVNAQELL